MKAFRDLSLTTKLLAAPLLLLIFMVLLGGMSYFALKSQATAIEEIFRVRVSNAQQIGEAVAGVTRLDGNIHKAITWNQAGVGRSRLEALGRESAGDLRALRALLAALEHSTTLHSGQRALCRGATAEFEKYAKLSVQALEMNAIDPGVAITFMNAAEKHFQLLTSQLNRLRASDEELSRRNLDEIHRSSRLHMGAFSAFLALTLVICLAGSLWVRGRIAAPITAVVGTLRDIASGGADLTRTLDAESRDEIGALASSFNRFVTKLANTVRLLKGVAKGLAEATDQLSTSSHEVAAGATEQARILSSSVTTVEGIQESTSGIAESTTSLLQASVQSSAAIQQMGATNQDIAAQMERLSENVEAVSTSIEELSGAGQQISAVMESLAVAAEQTAFGVSQLDDRVRNIQEIAQSTSGLSEGVVRDAEIGQRAVDTCTSGVKALREMADGSARVIAELATQADAIGRILTVVGEVAEQTDLLALNATILSAQSGEQGKAFAVVADEIRGLAERTAESTLEIATIVGDLQAGAKRAVEVMESERARAEQEVERAKEAEACLQQIRTSAITSQERASHIARLSTEHVQESRLMKTSVDQIAKMAEEVAASTAQQRDSLEVVAQSAAEMRAIASGVKDGTLEQLQGSLQIVEAIERVRHMVERINEETVEQTRRSCELLDAVSHARNIADGNAQKAVTTDRVVDTIRQQSAALEEEMGAFKT